VDGAVLPAAVQTDDSSMGGAGGLLVLARTCVLQDVLRQLVWPCLMYCRVVLQGVQCRTTGS
jgi:hypothetical protein